MNFDLVIDRRASDSVKWHYFPEDVLPMWVADMDFACPPAVMEALHKRVEHGIFGYACAPDGLKELVQKRLQTLYEWKTEADWISYVPGIVTGFNLAVRAFCEPGDGVIFQVPAYPPFFGAGPNSDLRTVPNPMIENPDGSYSLDFDRFETQIQEEKVKAFLLCNPHNPSGQVFSREELLRLGEICLRQGVYIISDEIHCDLLFDGAKHIPIASISEELGKVTATFIAPSKTYNIAGLHASVAIIPNPELREKYTKVRAGTVSDPNMLALVAAKAAYEFGDPWLQECLAYLQANRDHLFETLPQTLPGVKMYKAPATFLAWLDCRGTGLSEPHKFFLEKAKVGLNDGTAFGADYKHFVRLNFATPRSILDEGLQLMGDALLIGTPC